MIYISFKKDKLKGYNDALNSGGNRILEYTPARKGRRGPQGQWNHRQPAAP